MGFPIDEENQLPENVMLTQRAKKHFRLFRDPFTDDMNSADDVFLSDGHRYVRETMFQAARDGRFMAVVGESGSGKSTLRRDLIARIEREGHDIVILQPQIIDKGRLTSGTLCEAIIEDMGREKARRSLEAKARQVQELLIGSSRAGNRHVLIIEEAHDLTIDTMKQLKRFWELEDGFRHLLGIILVGQPELQKLLDERTAWAAREVIRRCEVATLEPIDQCLADYVALKFARADRPVDSIVAEDTYEAIRAKLTLPRGAAKPPLSMVYPLNVNNLVRRAMNLAAEMGEPRVTGEIVQGV